MEQYMCTFKYRDEKTSNILGYKLKHIDSGLEIEVASNELKSAIANRQVHITNLTLTSDGRLVSSNNDRKENVIKGMDKKTLDILGKLPVELSDFIYKYISENDNKIDTSMLYGRKTNSSNDRLRITPNNIESFYVKLQACRRKNMKLDVDKLAQLSQLYFGSDFARGLKRYLTWERQEELSHM